MAEKKKVRAKHVGFSGQREFCRNNGHTYTEKFSGETVLMCNYPFYSVHHKKGVCRASTCTDMREIPAEIVEADDLAIDGVETNLPEHTPDAVEDAGAQELSENIMPCPSND